ncbi:MAG: STAS domain-containing protein [Actinomycetota bacterium]
MFSTGRITIHQRRSGDVVVRLAGDLDEQVLTSARQAIAIAHATAGRHPVVLDLSQLTFIGAPGLRVLADTARALRATGTPLVLLRPSRHLSRVLRLTGIDQRARIAHRGRTALRAQAAA